MPDAVPDAPTPMDPEIQVREQHSIPIMGGWLKIYSVLIVSGVPIVALAVVIISNHHLFTAISLAIVYTLSFMAWSYRFETKRLTAWLLSAHSMAELPNGARLVGIAFDKSLTNRPRRTGCWRFLSLDDIGLLCITEDRVLILGDVVTLALTAADISRIEPARLWGTRCYTRVSLTRPITGHSTLVLGTNQYWPLKQMFKGHHELREDLRRFTDQKG